VKFIKSTPPPPSILPQAVGALLIPKPWFSYGFEAVRIRVKDQEEKLDNTGLRGNIVLH
jgi:hypothetical protein